MMLSTGLRHIASSAVRRKGEDYFRQKRVRDLTVEGGEVTAIVRGSQDYSVRLTLETEGTKVLVEGECDCPHFGQGEDMCKHLWATVLAAEKHGLGSLAPNQARVVYGAMDDDDESDHSDDIADIDTLRLVRMAAQAGLRLSPFGRGLLEKAGQVGSSKATRIEPLRLKPPIPPEPPRWKKLLENVSARDPERGADGESTAICASPVSPLYALDLESSRRSLQPVIRLYARYNNANGKLGKPRQLSLTTAIMAAMTDPRDRAIARMILGAGERGVESGYGYGYRYGNARTQESVSTIRPHTVLLADLLRRMSATGRLFTTAIGSGDLEPLEWREGPPWELTVAVSPCGGASVGKGSGKNDRFEATVELRRGDERLAIADTALLCLSEPDVCIRRGIAEPARLFGCTNWITAARELKSVEVRRSEMAAFVSAISDKGAIPALVLPEECGVRVVSDRRPAPRVELSTGKPQDGYANQSGVSVRYQVKYGELTADPNVRLPLMVDKASAELVRRDLRAEARMRARLGELGVKQSYRSGLELATSKVPVLVSTLLQEGWEVLGDQALYRKPGEFKMNLASGIDWFEAHGSFDFDGQSAELPELLKAVRDGQKFVTLGDGSLGVLPEAWLDKHRRWLELGSIDEGVVRFTKTQIGLLDAMLAEMPDVTCDAQVSAARKRLREFDGIAPIQEPSDFRGTLRDYQRDGLGWLGFLNKFGFGGCLADDMGLGKTVQMLAHIARLRAMPEAEGGDAGRKGPWLVVAPKSLIFNWAREAERFSPQLKVLTYTGISRKGVREQVERADIVLTTYATMRIDIEHLRAVEFAGLVLDEAQSIKNPTALATKAARLLKARRRLAMSGTPVENHLGDLWSIFEVLNPGMLGGLKAFRSLTSARPKTGDGEEGREGPDLSVINRAIRPFILRRTKEQVAKELPPRVEKTLMCELAPGQRKLYDELRDHYRTMLLGGGGRLERDGLAKSKIQVLEALLRLRQAACHPGLIDKKRTDAESAKLDTLLESLAQIMEEGHKALVFSQFTSMLALVKPALDKRKIVYEYLDGKTTDRAACVDRFQNDPACKLFLISLKAGGFGLNLTAADYVFILDPWWNPAVEAQAVDRAHRIGQSKTVIACRLIAKDTIEERIAELQASKKHLAEAVLAASDGLVASLTREDLERLLS